jgi:hypothetical protein
MLQTLFFFRLTDAGGLTITTDERGSRLPLDDRLGYKPEDWKFVAAISGAELSKVITSAREAEQELAERGYYTIKKRLVIVGHPFFAKHPA